MLPLRVGYILDSLKNFKLHFYENSFILYGKSIINQLLPPVYYSNFKIEKKKNNDHQNIDILIIFLSVNHNYHR